MKHILCVINKGTLAIKHSVKLDEANAVECPYGHFTMVFTPYGMFQYIENNSLNQKDKTVQDFVAGWFACAGYNHEEVLEEIIEKHKEEFHKIQYLDFVAADLAAIVKSNNPKIEAIKACVNIANCGVIEATDAIHRHLHKKV